MCETFGNKGEQEDGRHNKEMTRNGNGNEGLTDMQSIYRLRKRGRKDGLTDMQSIYKLRKRGRKDGLTDMQSIH